MLLLTGWVSDASAVLALSTSLASRMRTCTDWPVPDKPV